ncbi:hypothetical protein JW935_05815 [candidate division KSB1 bacterium]|nr:hypothetical protein [candidate division KSB1 bacterium]
METGKVDLNHFYERNFTQKILILINDAPYGTEKAYNVLRMTMTLQQEHAEDVELKIFLLGALDTPPGSKCQICCKKYTVFSLITFSSSEQRISPFIHAIIIRHDQQNVGVLRQYH